MGGRVQSAFDCRSQPRGQFGGQALVLETMRKTLRIILGIVVAGLVLHLADMASHDCRVAFYVYDNCMWLWLRGWGFPASRFLRMVFFECVGIVLALVLYLTFKYIFPFRRAKPAVADTSQPPVPDSEK